MTFEKETAAINLFVGKFKGSHSKVTHSGAEYKIFDQSGKHIAYAIVANGDLTIQSSYPLSVPAKAIVKLVDKRMPCVCIWACSDGIVYGHLDKISGIIKWGELSPHFSELISYFEKQPSLKYVKFISKSS